MKRIVSIAAVCILLLLMCSIPAAAETQTGTVGTLNWSFTDDGVLTITGQGMIPNMESPWFADSGNYVKVTKIVVGEGITRIGSATMSNMRSLTSIQLPSTLKELGSDNFNYCSSLTEVVLPEGLELMEGNCFTDCTSLKKVKLPSTLAVITPSCFCRCSALTGMEVAAGNTAYKVGDGVLLNSNGTGVVCYFAGLGYTSYTLPSTVVYTDGYVFAGCTDLTEFVFSDGFAGISWAMFEGCTNLEAVTLPAGLSYINAYAFTDCTKITSMYIPETVTFIGAPAFPEGMTIECVQGSEAEKYAQENNHPIQYLDGSVGGPGEISWSLKDGVLTVSGTGAIPNAEDDLYNPDAKVSPWFEDPANRNSIRKVVIKPGITRIGHYAFTRLPNLEEVVIPGTVTSIGGRNFDQSTKLKAVALPEGLEQLEGSCFENCDSLKTISIPASLKEYSSCFSDCDKLKTIAVAAGNPALKVQNGILYSADMTKLYLCPATLGIRTLTVPATVKNICWKAFNNCKALEQVTLPDGLEYIDIYAFRYCTALEQINLPNTLMDVAPDSFEGCTALKSISIPNDIRYISMSAFDKGTVLVCAKGSYGDNYAQRNNYQVRYTNEQLVYGKEGAMANAAVASPTIVLAPEQSQLKDERWVKYYEVKASRKDDTIVYDVDVINRDGESVDLAKGSLLVLPYPDGINYQNAAEHLINIFHYGSSGTELFSNQDGSLECMPQGLRIKASDFSPFAITWKNGTDGGNGGANQPPKTGDNDMPMLYLLLVLASVAILGVRIRKKA